MKTPTSIRRWLLLLLPVTIALMAAKLEATSSSDQPPQQSTPKFQHPIDAKSVLSEATSTVKPTTNQEQVPTSQQGRPKVASSSQRHNNGRARKTTTRQPTASNANQVSTNTTSILSPTQSIISTTPTSTTLDPYELAQDEIRRMMEYRNTPPLFVTPTRDFFVDVARYPLGFKLATMQAIDSEGDRIEYSLKPANYHDASSYFSINSTSGELRLANKKFHLDSSTQNNDSNHPTKSSQDTDDGDEDTEEADGHDEESSSQSSSQERPGYLYFLNVAANDGLYSSLVELQIHVFNSSSFGTKSAVQLTTEGSHGGKERIESIIRNKTNEFFDKLYRGSNQHSATINNSTILYPSFVNPGLTQPQELDSAYSSLLETKQIEEPVTIRMSRPKLSESAQATIQPVSPSTTIIPKTSSSINNNEIWHDQSRIAQHQQVELMPQQMFMSLVIVACSFLVIILVLLIFIVPLSVKRLRRRLKNVELHHEQLSRNASSTGGSSTLGSSSTGGSTTTGGHVPSLSQLTMSPFDGSCVMSSGSFRSSAVCRQSSLDSSLNGGRPTLSSSIYNHQQMSAQPDPMLVPNRNGALHQLTNGLNRVNNGSIANPMYLHQQHANKSPLMAMSQANQADFHSTISSTRPQVGYQHTTHAQFLPPMPVGQMAQNFSQESRNPQPSNDIYYPLDDEFYSTINTESTIVGNNTQQQQQQQPFTDHSILQMSPSDIGHHQVASLSGRTVKAKHYFASQCAQPMANHYSSDQSRETDTPVSMRSGSSTRSLSRFLSLPACHWANQRDEREKGDPKAEAEIKNAINKNDSYVDELNYHFGQVTLKHRDPVKLAKTLARTTHIDKEKQVRSGKSKRCSSVVKQTAHVWEIDRHRLKFLDILDEGQFGLVFRYKLRQDVGSETVVAVKTLKRHHHQHLAEKEEREREELLAEIEIMKLVCNHPNVVRLLHCCTTDLGGSNPILLVMEYMELGKLQSFLEKSRNEHTYATTISTSNNYSICPEGLREQLLSSDGVDQMAINELSANLACYDRRLTSRDLIKFIYHVAKGMEYISSKCIVHRDLASRNILLSSQRICKIGDFGMARHMQSLGDVYERHSRNTKIPVRWMAPEVLLNNRFTTKSDVFSFGILMWEIVTLGSTPYRHLKTEQVIEAVALDGERPSKPEYCHSELYTIMSSCWSLEPDDRPTFEQLVKQLDELVLSANEYIELDQYPDHIYSNIPKQAAPNELL